MMRLTLLAFVMAVSFVSPVLAGGPPRLCLPIDGVTTETSSDVAKLLTQKLQDKTSKYGHDRNVKVVQHKNQWYLAFLMGDDVALSDIEETLKGTKLSIPRKKLRLFGHVVLEVDQGSGSDEKILAGLKGLKQVSVAESADKDNRLLITVDMPYPANDTNEDRESVGWDTFRRSDFNSDPSDRSPIDANKLPSYGDFRELITKHQASLQDLHWSTNRVCRNQGGIAVAEKDKTVSTR